MKLKRLVHPLTTYFVAAVVVAMIGMTALAQQEAVAPADDAAGAAQVAATTTELSFLELLAKGGWFMLPIGLCSLLGLTIIFERLVNLRRNAVIPPNFMAGMKAAFRDPHRDREAAMAYCHANRSPIARVMAVGIRKMGQGEEVVEQAIEDAGGNEVAKLRRNLRMLFGVAGIAPMLGLLGTVWGMIEAFQRASQQGLGQAAELAGGIYIALVTTFAGLCVAIPLLVFYYYFVGKIERIVSEMNDVSEEFIEHVASKQAFSVTTQPAPQPKETIAPGNTAMA